MALTVEKIRKATKRGHYADGRGLNLVVSKAGVRSWALRYERDDLRPGREGKRRERWMGLGPVDDYTLEEARERARTARQLLKDGIDPVDHRKAERAKQAKEAADRAAKDVTFKAAAEQYFKLHSLKWKNAKHRAQFKSTLAQYAYPAFGNVQVADIDRTLVLKALTPIWHDKTETASRVRGRIESVLNFAKVQGWRDGENPAMWSGNLEHALPAPGAVAKVEHHAALPFAELPDFFTQLAKRDGIAARALEFTILSAARTNEIIGARWSEIDLDAQLWTIPAARMKARKEHRVPLSDRALKILKALPRESDFVFPGDRKGVPISNMAMAQLLKRMGRPDITVHGFRSTFRDWASEATDHLNHVAEMALAHVIDSKVEAAYRRGDLFAKRTHLMAAWAKYCTTTQHDATVTSINARRA